MLCRDNVVAFKLKEKEVLKMLFLCTLSAYFRMRKEMCSKPGGCPKKAVNNTRAGCEWGESGKPTDCNVMLQ